MVIPIVPYPWPHLLLSDFKIFNCSGLQSYIAVIFFFFFFHYGFLLYFSYYWGLTTFYLFLWFVCLFGDVPHLASCPIVIFSFLVRTPFYFEYESFFIGFIWPTFSFSWGCLLVNKNWILVSLSFICFLTMVTLVSCLRAPSQCLGDGNIPRCFPKALLLIFHIWIHNSLEIDFYAW